MRNRAGFLLSMCMVLPCVAWAGGGDAALAAGDLSLPSAQPAVPHGTAPSALPDDEAIKRAVREVLAEEKESQPGGASGQGLQHSATNLSSATEQKMTRAFDEAQLPLCLHSDGLRNQPTSIGPIGVVGLFALPFVAVAATRGVCRM